MDERRVFELAKKVANCEKVNNMLVESIQTLSEAYNMLLSEMDCFKKNVMYEVTDKRLEKDLLDVPTVLSCDATLDELLKGKKSLCRFGDGEFACISGNLRAKFTTTYSERLAKKLLEVLASDDENIMIAIADNYGSLEKYSEASKREIRSYMASGARKEHIVLLDLHRAYYNTYVTRPYITFADAFTDGPKNRFDKLKLIWKNRDVVLIEGVYTRFGVGNDLLSGAKSVTRILGPAVDAINKYDEIFKAAMQEKEDALYLLALGPVATVMAYDLAKTGRQAVDIGHLDLEYEWFLRGEGVRVPVPYKYVNEIAGGEDVEQIHDEKYESEIKILV